MDSSSVTIAWHSRYWESGAENGGLLSWTSRASGGASLKSGVPSSITSSEVSIGHDIVNNGNNGLSPAFVQETNENGKSEGAASSSNTSASRNGLASSLLKVKGSKSKVKSFSEEDDDDDMGAEDDDEEWRGGIVAGRGTVDEDDSYDEDDDIMLDDQAGEGEDNGSLENDKDSDWQWAAAAAGDILDNLGSQLTDDVGGDGDGVHRRKSRKAEGGVGNGSRNSRKKRQSSFFIGKTKGLNEGDGGESMQKDVALLESSIANMESDEEYTRGGFNGDSSRFPYLERGNDLEQRVKHISPENIDKEASEGAEEDGTDADHRKTGNNPGNEPVKGKGSLGILSLTTTRAPSKQSTILGIPSTNNNHYQNKNGESSGSAAALTAPSTSLSSGVRKSTGVTYKVEYYSAEEVRSEWLLGATDVSVEIFTLQYLKPNTEYIFFVRAVSPEGIVSAPSPLSESVITHISTSNRNNEDLELARERLDMGIVVLLKNAYPTSSTSIKIEWQVRSKSEHFCDIVKMISIPDVLTRLINYRGSETNIYIYKPINERRTPTQSDIP